MLTDNKQVIFVQEINHELLKQENLLLYIHTPFCGTCHIARSFVNQIELALDKDIFHEMNASFYPEFMQEEKIKSVPCLLIKVNGKVKEKIYTFYSVANIVHSLTEHVPEIFEK